MNWRTAILGLLVLYSGTGLLYAWSRSRGGSARDSMTLWAVLLVVFLLGVMFNEWIVRRQTPRKPDQNPSTDS